MISASEFFGVTAVTITVTTMVPYIRDTLRGITIPHRATWLIWSVLAVVGSMSQRADGASWSMLPAAVAAALNIVVLLLAARRGVGGCRGHDVALIACAGVGVVGWMFVGAPVFATVCVIVADGMGLALMIPKVFAQPDSETVVTYVGAVFIGGFAAASVGRLDISLLLYPVYYSLSSGALASVIVYRRRVLARHSLGPGGGPPLNALSGRTVGAA